ncbi:MAG: carotenoid oxygenase family protein [Actinomycetes bacterium]
MDVQVVGRALSTLPEDDDHPYRTGPWRPQTTEWAADDLDVEGEIPADLDGVYLRNTENPVHPAIELYHPFDGDGMIHMIGFRDGRAFYRNRFIRTDGFLAEQEAGRALWAGIAERREKGIRKDGWGARGGLKDSSSTDVVVHAGVALTSFYQCGEVYRLDPFTLDTLGKADWAPACGVSAHTKVDPRTGELLFFNYTTEAPYMHYGVVDADNRLVHYTDIPLPGPRLPHDMAFTENYAILNDLPLFWEPELLRKGVYAVRFHPELPSRLGVIPRRGGPGDIRWFEATPTYVLHWINAYEDGDEIVLDGFFQDDPEPADTGEGGRYRRMFRFLALDRMKTRLHRWRLNLATGAVKEERLTDTITEFGVANTLIGGLRHRYAYAATGVAGWFLLNGLVRHDTETGAEQHYRLPEGVYLSEPAMAPRVGATSEDDGYVLTFTLDMNEDRSDCLIFEASRIEDGPIARVRLPERICSGTHATWAPGSAIPGWHQTESAADALGFRR